MILQGDCVDLLAGLEPGSCQMCFTSPPYYGLRDYKIPPTAWPEITFTPMAGLPPITIPAETCCLGLEKSIWAFIGHTVHVFRGVHRALAKDGTLWLNIADSYAGSGRCGYPGEAGTLKGTTVGQDSSRDARKLVGQTARMNAVTKKGARAAGGVKAKELMGIPWMLAFALRSDGWYLRQDIIWNKPNPMPESCKDRCTKAHEYLFLFSKSKRYYFDQDAIAEPTVWDARNSKMPNGWDLSEGTHGAFHPEGRANGTRTNGVGFGHGYDENPKPRVTRPSGWAFGEDREHEELDGRFTGSNRNGYTDHQSEDNSAEVESDSIGNLPNERGTRKKRSVWTIATFAMKEAHYATFPPALVRPGIQAGSKPGQKVLDPFGGSGTVGMVAEELGRDWVLMELSGISADIAKRRTTGVQKPLQLETTQQQGVGDGNAQ